MQGTFETIDGRPALRFERDLAHPVDAVWRAVTDPVELAHWFPTHVTVDLRIGGAMSLSSPTRITRTPRVRSSSSTRPTALPSPGGAS